MLTQFRSPILWQRTVYKRRVREKIQILYLSLVMPALKIHWKFIDDILNFNAGKLFVDAINQNYDERTIRQRSYDVIKPHSF